MASPEQSRTRARGARRDGSARRDGGVIGRRLARVEDPPLLTGTAAYVDDLHLADTLMLRFLRSPVAHARISSVDAGAARSAPGVVDVVSAADLDLPPIQPPITNPASPLSPPRPVLADGVVRFVGEPVAAVVADSAYRAEDAAELVEVAYETLTAYSTAADALAPGAVALHEHDSNLLYDAALEVGDVDGAFAAAVTTVERTFVNPRYSPMPMEPRGALARPEGRGVRLWSSTQAPHLLRGLVAELLRLPPDEVRVACPDVGGGFGQKAHGYPEEVLVAWLALRLGRPVKWIEDRSDNLIATSHARDQEVTVRVAADGDGRLLAMEADVVCDMGAYGVYPHGHLLEPLGTPAMLPGPYRLPAYRARSRAVATNKCPEGAYRGVGLPVAAFVHERMMDLLAADLGMDRAEIRRRNFIGPDEMPFTTLTNQRYDGGDYARALETALDAIGYHGFGEEQARAREEGRLIGIGVSSYVEYTGVNSRVFSGRGMVGVPGYDSAQIVLGEDGRAKVMTTLPAIGQGTATTFAQMIADALGLPVDRVVVERTDTSSEALQGTGTFASRSAISGGGAIERAGAELRRRLLEDAAERLEASADDLEVVDGRVRVAGSPRHGVAVAELAAAADADRYRTKASFDPPVAYPYATHCCRVAVDAETGAVEIERYVVAEDCGTLINPLVVEGQTHGAVAQGIGGTMYESMLYDAQGQPVTASLMDYLVPTAAEMPRMELTHLEIPAPEAPNGAKGVGEGGTLAPPGALANAVADALGVEINELPLTPERVRTAARSAPAERPAARASAW